MVANRVLPTGYALDLDNGPSHACHKKSELSATQRFHDSQFCAHLECDNPARMEIYHCCPISSQAYGCLPNCCLAGVGLEFIDRRIHHLKNEKMKKILIPIALLLFFSCTEDGQKQGSIVEETPPQTPVESPTPEPVEEKRDHTANLNTKENLIGSYVGSFDAKTYDSKKAPSHSNRINLSITRVEDQKIFGHSVVAGNIRPFEGTYTMREDGTFDIETKEPGDDRYDGTFVFNVDLHRNKSVRGEWQANDKKLAVSVRSYALVKKAFEYNPDYDLPEDVVYEGLYATWEEDVAETLTSDVTKINASKTALKKEEVENLYKGDLEFIRNAVYARHGYSFKNRRVRYVFDNYVDWYIPHSTDIRDQLTDIEKENIALIKRYEEHAEEYYDSFGR